MWWNHLFSISNQSYKINWATGISRKWASVAQQGNKRALSLGILSFITSFFLVCLLTLFPGCMCSCPSLYSLQLLYYSWPKSLVPTVGCLLESPKEFLTDAQDINPDQLNWNLWRRGIWFQCTAKFENQWRRQFDLSNSGRSCGKHGLQGLWEKDQWRGQHLFHVWVKELFLLPFVCLCSRYAEIQRVNIQVLTWVKEAMTKAT